MLWQLLVFFVK